MASASGAEPCARRPSSSASSAAVARAWRMRWPPADRRTPAWRKPARVWPVSPAPVGAPDAGGPGGAAGGPGGPIGQRPLLADEAVEHGPVEPPGARHLARKLDDQRMVVPLPLGVRSTVAGSPAGATADQL